MPFKVLGAALFFSDGTKVFALQTHVPHNRKCREQIRTCQRRGAVYAPDGTPPNLALFQFRWRARRHKPAAAHKAYAGAVFRFVYIRKR